MITKNYDDVAENDRSAQKEKNYDGQTDQVSTHGFKNKTKSLKIKNQENMLHSKVKQSKVKHKEKQRVG